jgi:hypothetical protein
VTARPGYSIFPRPAFKGRPYGREVQIACGASLLWRASEMFEPEALAEAGDHASILIRDATCRLFGYHGLMHGATAFSFDHMFGF